MGEKTEAQISWSFWREHPGVKALERVLGSQIKLVSTDPKFSPGTITNDKISVDLHPLPDGVNIWINVIRLDRRFHASMGLVSPEISVEPSIKDPQDVTLRDREGRQIIIPKGGEVIFK